MPITFGISNILRMTLKGRWDGRVETNNVFHYLVTAVDGIDTTNNELTSAANALWYYLKDPLLLITSGFQVYRGITVDKLSLIDFSVLVSEDFTIPTGEGVGAASGDALPPANCWTFKLVRSTSAFRHGYKRFAGISEGHQANGLPTLSSSLLDDVAGQLDSELAPAAPGNELTSNARMHPTNYALTRGGEALDPYEIEDFSAVVFNGIGTQNSRKFGHGI